MKRNLFRCLTALALLSLSATLARADAQVELFKKSLRGVAAPEIPNKAASLVAQSRAAERETVALAVVEAAMEISPATAPEVVGSIASQTPEVAPAIAAAAAESQPKMAALTAKAAAASAPDYAAQIVGAICEKQPSASGKVAMEVARAVPRAGRAILNSLLKAFPNLKPYMDRGTAMAGTNGSADPSTSLVLAYTFALLEKTASSQHVTSEQLLSKAAPSSPMKALSALTATDLTVPLIADSLDSIHGNGPPPGPPPHGHHNYSKP